MKTVLCKTTDNIFYIRFPKPGMDIDSISTFNLKDKNLIDLTWLNIEYYSGYKGNEHHITTKTYYKIILPFLKLFVKDLKFDINEFNLIPHIVQLKDNIYDVSYLTPQKNEFLFSMNKNGKQLFTNCGFDCLHYINNSWGDNLPEDTTEYHKLFRGFHACCDIINETIDNDKKIFITGDSMSIPIIPILCCYFKEVVYMDNRDYKSHSEYYENKVFDYVIVQLWEGHPIEKPLGINLI